MTAPLGCGTAASSRTLFHVLRLVCDQLERVVGVRLQLPLQNGLRLLKYRPVGEYPHRWLAGCTVAPCSAAGLVGGAGGVNYSIFISLRYLGYGLIGCIINNSYFSGLRKDVVQRSKK